MLPVLFGTCDFEHSRDLIFLVTREDRPASGPPLLDDKEWAALKKICNGKG